MIWKWNANFILVLAGVSKVFSIKGQIANILGFTGSIASVTTTFVTLVTSTFEA